MIQTLSSFFFLSKVPPMLRFVWLNTPPPPQTKKKEKRKKEEAHNSKIIIFLFCKIKKYIILQHKTSCDATTSNGANTFKNIVVKESLYNFINFLLICLAKKKKKMKKLLVNLIYLLWHILGDLLRIRQKKIQFNYYYSLCMS